MGGWLAGFVAIMCVGGQVSAQKHIVIHVDDDAVAGGDGSGKTPYNNIAAALVAANATTASVTIKVAPGDYVITETLRISRSLDLSGSSQLLIDGDALPTGDVAAGTETRIVAASSLGAQPVILVGRSNGTVLSGVRIGGFVLAGTAGGVEVQLTRVQDYLVSANVFRSPANFGLLSVASSGRVIGNHFSGVGTGAIFTGGYPASPSSVTFTGNRSVRNTLGGALLNGASIDIPELGDQLDAVVRGNDLSDNTGNPNQSFGLRVFILRRDLGAPGDTQSSARVHALVQNNRIAANRHGIVIDAGFPYRAVGTVCDTRVYSGAVDLTFVDNTVTGSLVRSALVTFTRHVAALNQALLPQWQYLHGATFVIDDRDGALADAWIDHPELDPFLGPCPGDATHEPLGNVLLYNGAVVPNGRNF